MNSKKCFILILVIYCLVRIPLMLSNLVFTDELDRGVIAKAILEGSQLPFFDYQIRFYSASSLFEAVHIAPFFALFGDTLFALKLNAFFFNLLSLIAWYFVWKKHFLPRQTFFILLFFVSLPEITLFSLQAGSHNFDIILWVALTILIFRWSLSGNLNEIKAGLFLGLLGGVTSWMALSNFLTTVIIWLYLALLKDARIKKSALFGVYSIAFLIGFSPWLVYNYHYNWGGVALVETFFTAKDFLPHFYWLVRKGIAGILVFRQFSPIPKLVFTGVFTLFYFSSLVYLACQKRKSILKLRNAFDIEAFGLLYQILLLIFPLVSQKAMNKEYLIPMVPFMGMTLVVVATRVGEAMGRIWGRRLQTFLALFFITIGILGNTSLIRFNQLGSSLHMQGYSNQLFSEGLGYRFGNDLSIFQKKFRKFLEGRAPEAKKVLALGALNVIAKIKNANGAEKFRSSIELTDEEVRPIFFEKFGWAVGRFLKLEPKDLTSALSTYRIPSTFYPEFYRGFLSSLSGTKYEETTLKCLSLCQSAFIKAKPACYEGMGLILDPKYFSAKVSPNQLVLNLKIDPAYRSFYFLGLGRQFVRKWIYGTEFVAVNAVITRFNWKEWAWTHDDFDVFKDLRFEEKNWFDKGVNAEIYLQVEDPWLRETILRYYKLKTQ